MNKKPLLMSSVYYANDVSQFKPESPEIHLDESQSISKKIERRFNKMKNENRFTRIDYINIHTVLSSDPSAHFSETGTSLVFNINMMCDTTLETFCTIMDGCERNSEKIDLIQIKESYKKEYTDLKNMDSHPKMDTLQKSMSDLTLTDNITNYAPDLATVIAEQTSYKSKNVSYVVDTPPPKTSFNKKTKYLLNSLKTKDTRKPGFKGPYELGIKTAPKTDITMLQTYGVLTTDVHFEDIVTNCDDNSLSLDSDTCEISDLSDLSDDSESSSVFFEDTTPTDSPTNTYSSDQIKKIIKLL